MRDHNNSIALRVNVTEFFHDNVARAAVEVAGWLIGENNRRLRDKAASNGDALLLTTRELVRHVVFALLKMEVLENIVGGFQATSFGYAIIDERQRNVFDNRKSRDEVEILENEADFFGAEMGFLAGGNLAGLFAVEIVVTFGWLV